jgi:hypothetical protein
VGDCFARQTTPFDDRTASATDMTGRRYSDEEVARIFQLAAEAQHTNQPALPPAEGMTLEQIQEIGREVGFSPGQLSQAANAIELQPQPSGRRFLGFPIAVGLSVDFGRRLSDAEWDRLVIDLRETFDAKGVLKHEGSFRSWSNGNLQALLEPTETGQRLRIRTMKGDARGLMIGGIAMFGVGAITALTSVITGASSDVGMMSSLGTLTALGAGMFGAGALRLPPWARLRRRQMEEIVARTATGSGRARIPDITDA